MKKAVFLTFCVFSALLSFSQTDTLFTKKGQKLACKIYEINDTEIRYRMATALDGPIYVIDKTTVNKYTLSNGFSERLIPDELLLQNEHQEILGNRSVIKIHPFGFANAHISLAYEQVIKVGMNLDFEAGYVNSDMTKYPLGGSNSFGQSVSLITGAYLKPGLKFFLGQDFSVKGLRYAHPLKGRYLKLDVAISYLNFQNLQAQVYSNTGIYPGGQTYTTITTDLNSFSYGGFINYGRQFILGNILTFDYYFGLGFTGQSNSYTNSSFLSGLNQSYMGYYDNSRSISNYYGYLRLPNVGLSFTMGIRIGFILPSKKSSNRSKADSLKKTAN